MQRTRILSLTLLATFVAFGLHCGETQEERATRIEKLINEAFKPNLTSRMLPEAELEKAEEAKRTLAAMGQEAVPSLIERVRSGQVEVAEIFRAMAPTGISELVNLLTSDDNPGTRRSAALVIGRLRGKDGSIAGSDAHQALHEAAVKDKDVSVRKHALEGLGNLGVKIDRDVLLKALGDEEPEVRRAAVAICRARISLEKADAIQALRAMTYDESAQVREAVDLALCDYRDESAIPLLIDAMVDENVRLWKSRSAALEGWFHQRFYGTGPDQTTDWHEVARQWEQWWEANEAGIHTQFTITIRPGDTFSGLASDMYAKDTPPGWESRAKRQAAIMAANPGIEPTKRIDGHTLIIPRLRPLNPDDY